MDPTLRAMLDEARKAHEPSPEARARAKKLVYEDLPRARRLAKVKLGAGIGGGGLVGAVALWLLLSSPSTPQRPLPPPPPPSSSIVAAPVPTAARSSDEAVAIDDLPRVEPSAKRAPPSTTVSAQPESGGIDAEMAILSRAQRALAAHDDRGALAACEEHARTFPNGALVEEREAARIVALCRLGRSAEGMAARSRFLADHPHSPLANRVQNTSCVSDTDRRSPGN